MDPASDLRRRHARGLAAGLISAGLFSLATPFSKRLLPDVHWLIYAGLAYLSAGLALVLLAPVLRRVRPSDPSERLDRTDLPRLGTVILAGGLVAPALALGGLTRVSGVVGSLLLNLETPFTVLLALLFFGDRLTRRATASLVLVLLGAVILSIRPGEVSADLLGVLAVAGACLAWGLDNNVTQRLARKDAIQITRVKCLAAGAGNTLLGLAVGGRWPAPGLLLPIAVVGVFCFGVSLVFATLSLRWVGASRYATCLATAPFLGALASIPILGESPRLLDAVSALLMVAGITILLRTAPAGARAPGTS